MGACSVRSRFQAVARRGLSRFVGRDAEMEALAAALAEAGQGRGQVVAVVGEPGVGKSRLLHELVHSHRTHGWLVLESGAVSYGKATSYLPVIDLLKGYFKVGDRDDQRVVREKVTGKLLTLDRALEAELSPLLALLDLPLDDPQWQALDPPRRRSRTVHAVKRLLVRESQVQPLALAFEDLHWIDSETQALLDSLTESLPAARILVLVNYRFEYQHAWGSKTYYRQLRLDPLPTATTEELLRALLGGGTELESLKRLLVDRTERNPFFLEESVRTLVESGALAGRPGAYRLAVPVHEVRAPATVQAVLSARIDRLPPEDKRLLETAAVIGKDVPFGLLQHVAELPEDGLRQTLARLQTAEFLYETRLFPDLEYTFKHALTHEVAYRGLTHERRQALHARVVDGIERQWPEGLTERVEVLAHHAVRGGAWEKAVDYLRQAGAKAAARYATREAAELFLQALAALAHLPASREVAQRTIDLHFDLRHCFVVLARLDELGEHLRQAEALAGSIGDQRRLGWAYAYKSWWLSNHPEEAGPRNAIDAGERALAIAAALGDVELELSTRYFLNIPYNHSGNYRRAIDLTRQNIEVLSGEQARRRSNLASGTLPSVISRWGLANSLAEIGEFAEGVASIREGLSIPDADDHVNLAFLYGALGALLVAKGDSRDAIEALEHALRLCESSSLRILWSMTASRLGLAYLMEGRTAEALSSLEQAAAAAARGRQGRSQSRVALGEGYLVASRLDDARGQARQALELARSYGERGWEAWSLRLMAEIASHPDALAPEEPSRWYREAIAIADELGMRPLVAHCHLGLGTLYAKTGRREEARQHLASAAAMYREMDMRFWLAKAEEVGEL